MCPANAGNTKMQYAGILVVEVVTFERMQRMGCFPTFGVVSDEDGKTCCVHLGLLVQKHFDNETPQWF